MPLDLWMLALTLLLAIISFVYVTLLRKLP
jgi:hypothetical protein